MTWRKKEKIAKLIRFGGKSIEKDSNSLLKSAAPCQKPRVEWRTSSVPQTVCSSCQRLTFHLTCPIDTATQEQARNWCSSPIYHVLLLPTIRLVRWKVKKKAEGHYLQSHPWGDAVKGPTLQSFTSRKHVEATEASGICAGKEHVCIVNRRPMNRNDTPKRTWRGLCTPVGGLGVFCCLPR